MSNYKRKYTMGGTITSLDELVRQEFIYQGTRIVHNGWFMSHPARMLLRGLEEGWYSYAIKNEVIDDEQRTADVK